MPEKKTGRARSKRKGRLARSSAVALRARRGSAYRCLLRFRLAFGHAWVFCQVDAAVPWRGFRPRRGARTHLTSFSFRAFRFATRCPGGRRSGSLAYAAMLHLSSTTGQRQRKEKLDVSLTSPGQRSPQGQRVSVLDCREGLPTFPRRRQEVCACADRPAEFSTGRGAFSS